MTRVMLKTFRDYHIKHLQLKIRIVEAYLRLAILTSHESTSSRGMGTRNPRASSRVTGACFQCVSRLLGVICNDEIWSLSCDNQFLMSIAMEYIRGLELEVSLP